MSDLLSESRFDEAIQGASVHHRAALYKHFFLLQARIKALEAELAAVPPPTTLAAPAPIDATRQNIVTWLRRTHTADTVRAAYARKLASLIEEGADEADAPTEEHAA